MQKVPLFGWNLVLGDFWDHRLQVETSKNSNPQIEYGGRILFHHIGFTFFIL